MSKKRRNFSNQEKFAIVLEALKGHRQIAEIASEYNVHLVPDIELEEAVHG